MQLKLPADDIKIYLNFDVTDYCTLIITVGQDNINRLVRENNAWGLSMNVCKCA